MARGKKSSEASAPTAKGGDPLKYYCIVFALLIILIGVIYWRQRKSLETYRAENVFAEKVLTGKGMPETDSYGRPNAIPPLGLQVETMVGGYQGAVGSESGQGIAMESILSLAKALNIDNKNMSRETTDRFAAEGYEEVWREITFAETNWRTSSSCSGTSRPRPATASSSSTGACVHARRTTRRPSIRSAHRASKSACAGP